ncbi:hypothetical protein JCM8547_008909 [Rhodosporidiobolus lusitaniae]
MSWSSGEGGGGGGVPQAYLDAMRDYHVSRSQADLCSVLFSGIVYGMILTSFFRYLSLYWHGDATTGRKRDSLGLRLFVVATMVLATGFLGVVIASTWHHLTKSIRLGGIWTFTETSLQVSEYWVVLALAALTEGFWTYRACRVSRNKLIIAIAVPLYLATMAAFLVTTVQGLKTRIGETVSLEDSVTWILTVIWLTFFNTIYCAGVLAYYLWWKRRDSLVQSSRINAVMDVAVRTAGIISILNVIGGSAAAYTKSTGNTKGLLVCNIVTKLYGFGSAACAFYSLLQRHSATTSTSVLPTSVSNGSKLGRAGGGSNANVLHLSALSAGGRRMDEVELARSRSAGGRRSIEVEGEGEGDGEEGMGGRLEREKSEREGKGASGLL